MDTWQVVVVGGGSAGDAVVEALRKTGFDGSIALVGAERYPVCYRPHLSKDFLRDEMAVDRVFFRGREPYEGMDVEWLLGRTAVAASRRDSSIRLDDGREMRFETLVLATGGSPRLIPGLPPAANLFVLRTLDHALALKEAMAGGGRLLVIGAGFIGAEVAASMRTNGAAVLLVELAPVPLGRALSPEMGEVYARIHRDHGVDLRTGTSVVRWHLEGDRVRAVELEGGGREEVDAVLVAVGIEPELSLARELELPLAAGGVQVDEMLRAEPNIYCAGDMAAQFHPLYKRPVRVEHWQVARRQGVAIGRAISGEAAPFEEVPWFWSDQYDVNLQYLGQAESFDQTVWRGDPSGTAFSVFYLRDGVVEAMLAVNQPRSIRFGRDLIRRRSAVDAERLADEGVDLKELASA